MTISPRMNPLAISESQRSVCGTASVEVKTMHS